MLVYSDVSILCAHTENRAFSTGIMPSANVSILCEIRMSVNGAAAEAISVDTTSE